MDSQDRYIYVISQSSCDPLQTFILLHFWFLWPCPSSFLPISYWTSPILQFEDALSFSAFATLAFCVFVCCDCLLFCLCLIGVVFLELTLILPRFSLLQIPCIMHAWTLSLFFLHTKSFWDSHRDDRIQDPGSLVIPPSLFPWISGSGSFNQSGSKLIEQAHTFQ